MKLNFDIQGDDELRSKLKTLQGRMKNLRPLYKAWGIQTLKWIQENYRKGGGKLKTGPWKRLKPMTMKSRRRGSNKPLMDTGHLLRQWNWKLKLRGVVIGNPMDVAKFHEEGTKPYVIKPVNRKFLWFGVPPADRRRGQQLGGYHEWRVKSKPYKRWGRKGAPGIFTKEVKHPGLPARRQLPSKTEIMPDLIKVADIFLEKATK